MKWFDGSVEDAVSEAKSRNCYFVVFIDGNNKASEIMTSVLNLPDISNILESENYICVLLKSNSQEYKHFVEIYKHVPIPSLFLIGVNGVPLGIISSSPVDDKNSLHQQILKVLSLRVTSSKSVTLNADSVTSKINKRLSDSSQPSGAESKESTRTKSTIENVMSNLVNLQNASTASDMSDSYSRKSYAESNVSSTQALISSLSDEKQTDEPDAQETAAKEKAQSSEQIVAPNEEKQKRTSTEKHEQHIYLATGKVQRANTTNQDHQSKIPADKKPSVQTPKLEQSNVPNENQQTTKAQEEIQQKNSKRITVEELHGRNKKVNNNTTNPQVKKVTESNDKNNRLQEIQQDKIMVEKDRKRILHDIANDRKERQSRQQEMTKYQNKPIADGKTINSSHGAPLLRNQTRIQFRMPEGIIHTEIFNVNTELHVLHKYVVDNLHFDGRRVTLASSFPRHLFSEAEYSKTLQELQLVPNAVILILLSQEPKTITSYLYDNVSKTLKLVSYPFVSLYNFVQTSFSSQPPPMITQGVLMPRPNEAQNRNSSGQPSRPFQGPSARQNNVQTIGKYNRNRKPNDKNNVWNGNSTQQSQ